MIHLYRIVVGAILITTILAITGFITQLLSYLGLAADALLYVIIGLFFSYFIGLMFIER